MKKTLHFTLAALVIVAMLLTAGCERKVTVLTGEIVLCTAGEILEDNTEEIEVPASEVADYGVTTRVITCELHGDLAADYAAAQKAIAEGDLVAAREKLRTIVDSDPTYRQAASQLAEIDAGNTPDVDTSDVASGDTNGTGDTDGTDDGDTDGGDGGGTDQPTDEPTGPVASLTTYVPDQIPGYVAQGIIADLASLSRQYIPESADADQLVIEVQQHPNAETATYEQEALAGGYPDGTTSSTISGLTVLAGTRGEYAAAVFADGPLTVVVELHATGSSAAGLIDAVLAVVESITR